MKGRWVSIRCRLGSKIPATETRSISQEAVRSARPREGGGFRTGVGVSEAGWESGEFRAGVGVSEAG